MTILRPAELKYLLLDNLKKYSENVIFIGGTNPYEFIINKRKTYILIKNVSDSGRGRTNPDECRVQMGGTKSFLKLKGTYPNMLFLGYYSKNNVFTAWDPKLQTKRIGERKNVSFYSRFSVMDKASKKGMFIYTDENGQVVISFRSEYLGLYIENFSEMHKSKKKILLRLIKEEEKIREISEPTPITIKRMKFTITHFAYKRDRRFSEKVKKNYDYRCTFCGIQLDLIEAPHIIPHAHEKSNDDPRNGVCLCAIHHKAYDEALIYFTSDFKIHVNEEKLNYLRKMNLGGESEKFLKLHLSEMLLPKSEKDWPKKEWIIIGNECRGIVKGNK